MIITDDSMRSIRTPHTAERHREYVGAPWWVVSWLPGRHLTRNQAVTAMTLAEVAQGCLDDPDSGMWPFVGSWAAELGVAVTEAVTMAASSPEACQANARS
jgi:hypothetical protein